MSTTFMSKVMWHCESVTKEYHNKSLTQQLCLEVFVCCFILTTISHDHRVFNDKSEANNVFQQTSQNIHYQGLRIWRVSEHSCNNVRLMSRGFTRLKTRMNNISCPNCFAQSLTLFEKISSPNTSFSQNMKTYRRAAFNWRLNEWSIALWCFNSQCH